MSFSNSSPIRIAAALFALLVTAAQAQQVKVEVAALEVQLQQSPDIEFSGPKDKKWDPKSWLEMEVAFTAQSSDRNAEFIEELEFVYYVYFDGAKDAQTKVYTRSVKVTNIPQGEGSFTIAYMTPQTLEAAYGKGKAPNERDVWVAVEVRSSGALVGGKASEKESTRWWQSGQAQRVEGSIFAKHETPFQFLWYDRHVQEKRDR
ncbi:MAG: Amuc_1102 family pilus-like protein [Verrucomicrobiota bacterium]